MRGSRTRHTSQALRRLTAAVVIGFVAIAAGAGSSSDAPPGPVLWPGSGTSTPATSVISSPGSWRGAAALAGLGGLARR
jgi:MYXO-CTERM domain-containing protein